MNLLQCGIAARASRADTRRRHLTDVARTLFIEHGFQGTGVAQIAAASGIRVGQIYRDFQSKEDIVAAIVRVDLATFLDREVLTAAIGSGDVAAVRDWIDRIVLNDEPIEKCRMMTEIVAESARNKRIADVHHAIDLEVRELLTMALAALVPGAAAAPHLLLVTNLIMAMGIGLVNRRIADPHLDAPALAAAIGRVVDREIAELTRPGAG